jgi:acyl-coenzyme A thioesterase PaaI-like protein
MSSPNQSGGDHADETPSAFRGGADRVREASRPGDRLTAPSELARRELAAATRRIGHELVSTTATAEAIAEATELVNRAAELLAAREHGRPYEGAAEGSLKGGLDVFIDHSPFIGLLNPLSPPISLELDDDKVIGRVVYGTVYEGAPGCLHGGFIAAGFDEVLGFAQSLSGASGMTGRLEVSFRSPTPLHRPLVYTGWIDRVDGRKIYTSATLHDGDTLCAEATGLFITMKAKVFERLMEMRAIEGGR